MSSTIYSGTYTNGVTLNNPGAQRTVSVTGTISKANGTALQGSQAFGWNVNNSGTIKNTGTTGNAIVFFAGGTIDNSTAGALIEGYNGIFTTGAAASVTNLGSIVGQGAETNGVYLAAGGSVVNGSAAQMTATITGGNHGVLIGYGKGTVTNFGTISNTADHAAVALVTGGTVTNGSSTSTAAKILGAGTGVYITGGIGTVTNFGTISSNQSTGVSLRGGGSVTNGSTSVTTATIAGANNGVFIDGGVGTFANFGTVQNSGSHATVVLEAGGSVTNGAATSTAALITGPGTGVYTTGAVGTVTNFGTIKSTGTTTTLDGTGVVLFKGGTVTNAGTIADAGPNTSGVYILHGGTVVNTKNGTHVGLISAVGAAVSFRGTAGTVQNSGTITGGTGVYLNTGGNVTNQSGGVIKGTVNGVYGRGVPISVTNTGSISGTSNGVYLRGGGTIVNQSGGVISGGTTGIGIKLRDDTNITNAGTITGTSGIYIVHGGTFTITNSGTIASSFGTTGVAVNLGDTTGTKLLIVEPTAKFVGAVDGGGSAEIEFVGGGTANMAGVSGFSTIDLANGVSHTLTLTNANAPSLYELTVIGGNDGNTVNASAVTSYSLIFEGSTGTDNYTGGSNKNVFVFSPTELTGTDAIHGGTGGNNELQMTAAGSVVTTGVVGIEYYLLSSGAANTMSLSNANFTTGIGSQVFVFDGNNGDTINGSAITNASDNLLIHAGGGTEHLTGGAGNDTFEFGGSGVTASDTINGGGGTNTLLLNAPGNEVVTGVTGVENYVLADGGANTLTLTNANFTGVTGNMITVSDGNGGNSINAGALTAGHDITVYAGPGADAVTGGAGNDIYYAGGDTTINGGGGADQFIFDGVGNNTVTSWVHGTDKLVFSNAGFSLGESGATSTPQALAASFFSTNTNGTFATTADRFAYNASTGQLFYDAGGSATPGAVHLVVSLTGHPTVTASDLYFVT